MTTEMIRLDEPVVGEEEVAYLSECIRSRWLSWQGSYVERFQREFAVYCGSAVAIATANGTAALVLALQALGIGKGDEVIVPALTFSATAFAVSIVGADVVFADCRPGHVTVDPDDVERRISARTKAVVPVHLYGRPADMDAVVAVAKRHKLKVVEDAAQAVGAEYKGRKVGSIGDIGCFSFHNKLISTGEGGMIVTNDSRLAELVRQRMNPSPDNRGAFSAISANARMSNLQAAVGTAQLQRLEKVIEGKRRVAKLYERYLSHVKTIELIPEPPEGRSVFWRYSVLVDDRSSITRDRLVAGLRASGIEARAMFYALHRHAYYARSQTERSGLPVAESLSRRGIDLPSSATLDEEQIRRVVDTIATCCRVESAKEGTR